MKQLLGHIIIIGGVCSILVGIYLLIGIGVIAFDHPKCYVLEYNIETYESAQSILFDIENKGEEVLGISINEENVTIDSQERLKRHILPETKIIPFIEENGQVFKCEKQKIRI